MLFVKVDMVNKRQYEGSKIYNEIKIVLPRELEELKRDLEYLKLNYENYTIQDTHIKECEFLDNNAPLFATNISKSINEIINMANESGYTTPFQNINKFYEIIKNFNLYERDILLAIMEVKKEQINNIDDAIKYAKNINCFALIDACDYKELARKLIHDGEIDIEDLMDYADLETLGIDYSDDKKIIKTEYGFLSQECDLKNNYIQENDEEEEM